MMKKVVILASGNGSNAQNIAEYFATKKDVTIAAIFSNNPKAYVLERAKRLNITGIAFNRTDLYSTQNILNQLDTIKPDLIILAGFLWLIPENIIRAYANRIVNIHPALLPNYGGKGMYGMRVHESVIEHHEETSGITIHLVNENYDEGDILFQARCTLSPKETPESLAQKIHALEYKHFPEIIENYLKKLT